MMTTILVIGIIILFAIFLAGIVSVMKVQKNKVDHEYFYVLTTGRKKHREKCNGFWHTFKKFYVQTLVNILLFNIG